MNFGLFNVITALYVENTVAAAKYNQLHLKHQRLLDGKLFAEKMTQLVEFVWAVHKSKETQPDGTGSSGLAAHHWRLNSILSRPSKQIDEHVEEMGMLSLTPEFFAELRSFKEFQEILR